SVREHHGHDHGHHHHDERDASDQRKRPISERLRSVSDVLHQMSPSALCLSEAITSADSSSSASSTRRSPSAACSGVTPRSTSSSYSSSTPAPHSSIAPIDSALTIGTSTCFSSDMFNAPRSCHHRPHAAHWLHIDPSQPAATSRPRLTSSRPRRSHPLHAVSRTPGSSLALHRWSCPPLPLSACLNPLAMPALKASLSSALNSSTTSSPTPRTAH